MTEGPTGSLPPAEQSRNIAISVGPLSIPSEVDRPQIVVNEGPLETLSRDIADALKELDRP